MVAQLVCNMLNFAYLISVADGYGVECNRDELYSNLKTSVKLHWLLNSNCEDLIDAGTCDAADFLRLNPCTCSSCDSTVDCSNPGMESIPSITSCGRISVTQI